MNKYFLGIDWDPFEGISGIYVSRHHIKGYRYFSTYKNGESKKKTIFQKLASAGMKEIKGNWDWHHVVEGNHLASLYDRIQYHRLYSNEWPTALLHSAEEHKILNSLFRSIVTMQGLQKPGAAPLVGAERNTYLRKLYQRYQDIYTSDSVLQKVAHNIIRSIV